MVSITSLPGELLRRVDQVAGTRLYDGLLSGFRVGAAVSPGGREHARMVLAGAILGSGRTGRPLRVQVRGPVASRPFWIPDLAGLLVLDDVFCEREYDLPLPQQPRRILDLGSHIGASILFFSLRYPGAAIVGIEPSPRMFKVLAANVAGLPGVTVQQAAVGADSEPVTFYEGTTSWAGSTRPGDEIRLDSAVTIPGVAFDDLLAPGVDLLKIDIEGGEFEILPVAAGLSAVSAVVGEIHAPPGSDHARRMLELMPDHTIESTPDDASDPKHFTVFSAIRKPTA